MMKTNKEGKTIEELSEEFLKEFEEAYKILAKTEKFMKLRAQLKDHNSKKVGVIKEIVKKYVDGPEDYYLQHYYKCSLCKKLLHYDRYGKLQEDDKSNFCKHCGQGLNWNNIEEVIPED